MRISRKIEIAFGLALAWLLLIAGQAIWVVQRERSAVEAFHRNSSKLLLLEDLKSLIYRQIKEVPDYLTGRDPDAKEEYAALSLAITGRFNEWTALVTMPDEARRFDELRAAYERLATVANDIFMAPDGRNSRKALDLMEVELEQIALPALDWAIENLQHAFYQSSIQSALAETRSLERMMRWLVPFTLLTAVGVGVAIYLWLSRGLVRPLKALVEAAREVGSGNLGYRVRVTSRDEIGEVASAFLDMTDRLKQIRQRIIESERMASIGATATAVAHGMQNPLASIRALAQVALRDMGSPSAIQESLQEIIGEVDRLSRRITHLLDFTRPVRSSPIPVDLNALVEGFFVTFEKTTSQVVTLVLQLDPALPPAILDPPHMEQVLCELTANALEAMPHGGELHIVTRMERRESDLPPRVVLEVKDSGEGIPPTALPHVFEPFYTTRADGTGLGLSIVRRFVEQDDGTVTLESQPGRGTSVLVAFPAGVPDAATHTVIATPVVEECQPDR